MDNVTLIMITLFFISSGLVIAVLNFMQSRKNKKFKRTLEKLEIEKTQKESDNPKKIEENNKK